MEENGKYKINNDISEIVENFKKKLRKRSSKRLERINIRDY